jgi:regulator of replication initiation timing
LENQDLNRKAETLTCKLGNLQQRYSELERKVDDAEREKKYLSRGNDELRFKNANLQATLDNRSATRHEAQEQRPYTVVEKVAVLENRMAALEYEVFGGDEEEERRVKEVYTADNWNFEEEQRKALTRDEEQRSGLAEEKQLKRLEEPRRARDEEKRTAMAKAKGKGKAVVKVEGPEQSMRTLGEEALALMDMAREGAREREVGKG